jgi:hypothetical protein
MRVHLGEYEQLEDELRRLAGSKGVRGPGVRRRRLSYPVGD